MWRPAPLSNRNGHKKSPLKFLSGADLLIFRRPRIAVRGDALFESDQSASKALSLIPLLLSTVSSVNFKGIGVPVMLMAPGYFTPPKSL